MCYEHSNRNQNGGGRKPGRKNTICHLAERLFKNLNIGTYQLTLLTETIAIHYEFTKHSSERTINIMFKIIVFFCLDIRRYYYD